MSNPDEKEPDFNPDEELSLDLESSDEGDFPDLSEEFSGIAEDSPANGGEFPDLGEEFSGIAEDSSANGGEFPDLSEEFSGIVEGASDDSEEFPDLDAELSGGIDDLDSELGDLGDLGEIEGLEGADDIADLGESENALSEDTSGSDPSLSDFGLSDFADLVGESEPAESDDFSAALDEENAADLAEPEAVLSAAEVDEGKKGKKGKAKKEKPAKAKKEKQPKVKKEKPPKVKKEKKPKPPKAPRDPNAPGIRFEQILTLGACLLVAVVFVAINVLVVLRGGMSAGTITFLVILDVIGAIIFSVPFLFYKGHKTLTVFEVFLGVALIAISVGAILLLAEFYRYDFAVNKDKTVSSRTQVVGKTSV